MAGGVRVSCVSRVGGGVACPVSSHRVEGRWEKESGVPLWHGRHRCRSSGKSATARERVCTVAIDSGVQRRKGERDLPCRVSRPANGTLVRCKP